jgi:hypothetical protein
MVCQQAGNNLSRRRNYFPRQKIFWRLLRRENIFTAQGACRFFPKIPTGVPGCLEIVQSTVHP